MTYKNKRGISPLIATVLLVGLVVVLGVLFFLFAKGQITAQLQKQQCEGTDIINIDFSAECKKDENSVTLTNHGQGTIDGVRFIFNEQSPGPSMINLKPGDTFTVNFKDGTNLGDDVEVIPLIMKESEDKAVGVLCIDKSVTASCLE